MTHLPDVTLVARAQQGDRVAVEALVARHPRRAEAVTLSFFVPGSEREDLKQEAVLGLLAAIRDYRSDAGSSFVTFLYLCVWRHLTTFVRASFRDKNRTLGESLRMGREVESGELVSISELIPDPGADVPRQAETRAELGRLLDAMPSLSDLERRSLVAVSFGYSYGELEAVAGTEFKAADNAIQRARRKLRRAA